MKITDKVVKKKPGQQLLNAERDVLIAKLVEALCNGHDTGRGLAKLLGVDTRTIASMRPLAEELIRNFKFDRSYVRNKQVKVVYKLVEGLIVELERPHTIKEISMLHSAIAKHHQHLALILGLNTEVQVHTGAQQLVIIRASQQDGNKTTVIDGEQVSNTQLD